MDAVLCEDDVKQLAGVFKALGDVNRLTIMGILALKEREKVCVTDLAKILGITQPAVSQHMKTLKTAGMVEAVKEGNFTYYSFNWDNVNLAKKRTDQLFDIALEKRAHCKKLR